MTPVVDVDHVTKEDTNDAAASAVKDDAGVDEAKADSANVKSKVEDSTTNQTPPVFNQNGWFRVLCEYMMTQETPFVRRQVRKLLLFICGTKTKVKWIYYFIVLNYSLAQLCRILELKKLITT